MLEDEASIRLTLTTILRHAGYMVAAFGNGLEAVADAKNVAPDLALLDVIVPGLDGVSVAIEILSFAPYCKILLLSGTNEALPEIRRSEESGFHFNILPKPVAPEALLTRLAELLDEDSAQRRAS